MPANGRWDLIRRLKFKPADLVSVISNKLTTFGRGRPIGCVQRVKKIIIKKERNSSDQGLRCAHSDSLGVACEVDGRNWCAVWLWCGDSECGRSVGPAGASDCTAPLPPPNPSLKFSVSTIDLCCGWQIVFCFTHLNQMWRLWCFQRKMTASFVKSGQLWAEGSLWRWLHGWFPPGVLTRGSADCV